MENSNRNDPIDYVVLEQAIKVYGIEKQTDMAIEEMSELTKALLKHRRAIGSSSAQEQEITKRDISEEIADVYIMLSQLIIIYRNSVKVKEVIRQKCIRLKERLDKNI